MKRFSKEHAKRSAQDFAASSMAEHWDLFAADIRNALLDQHVMNEIRLADRAESEHTYTATDIVQFREDIANVLQLGIVPTGKRFAKRAYKVEE